MSCSISLAAIESRGVQPLLDMVKRLGGWPVLDGDSWDEKSFSWEKSVYNFRGAGYSVDYFLDFSISVDVKNSTKRIIDVRIQEYQRRLFFYINLIWSADLVIELDPYFCEC